MSQYRGAPSHFQYHQGQGKEDVHSVVSRHLQANPKWFDRYPFLERRDRIEVHRLLRELWLGANMGRYPSLADRRRSMRTQYQLWREKQGRCTHEGESDILHVIFSMFFGSVSRADISISLEGWPVRLLDVGVCNEQAAAFGSMQERIFSRAL